MKNNSGKKHALLVYILLTVVWTAIIIWQIAEHRRVRNSVYDSQLNRAHDIANSLAVVIRSQRRFGTVPRNRLAGALEELAASRELLGIALLNPASEILASGGQLIKENLSDLKPGTVERKGDRLIVASLVELGTDRQPRGRPGSEIADEQLDEELPATAVVWSRDNEMPAASTEVDGQNNLTPEDERAQRRVRWERMRSIHPRFQTAERYQEIYEKQGLHMMALLMDNRQAVAVIGQDMLFRVVLVSIAFFAVLGLALAWRAITRSSQLQIRLARARSQNSYLRELNLAAAGLAHETRNPLNIVRSITQMSVNDEQMPSQARRQLQKALQEVDHMTARLNEFIDYSKPREPHLSAVAPVTLAHDVARTLQTDFEDKNIDFHCSDKQIQILADAGMLRQVLFNLLLNAVQAAAVGGTIEIRLNENDTKAELEVVDDGPGVPAEAREDIFRPYFTLGDHGSGLGLAVVRQIVFAHGWKIACEANPAGGSIFHIREMEITREQHET